MNKALEALRPTKKEWSKLSHSNKEILKKLDLTPKPAKRKQTLHIRKATPIEQEYDVVATITCGLCNMKSVEYLRMEHSICRFSKEPLLKKRAITWDMIRAPWNTEKHITPCCNECRTELLTWSKPELIKGMIKLTKSNAASIWRR